MRLKRISLLTQATSLGGIAVRAYFGDLAVQSGESFVDFRRSLIGWRGFGILGLLVATFAVILPPGFLAIIAGRMEVRFSSSAFFKLVRISLPPIVIGLMMASALITAKIAVDGFIGIAIAAGVAIFVALTKQNPLIPIVLSIVVGIIAGRLGYLV